MRMEEHDRTLSAASRRAARMARELSLLHHDIAELRKAVEGQAAEIAWLKQESARHERNHQSLWEHVLEEFKSAFLWIDALGCRTLPKAVTLANELGEKIGRPAIIPPHRLRGHRGTVR